MTQKNIKPVENPVINLIEGVIDTFEFMSRCGLKGCDPAEKTVQILKQWSQGAQNQKGKESLKQIRADLGDCRRCKLWKGRSNIVFGAGNPEARLVFVGEAPGYDEDRIGEPFVGKAGRLLTRIIGAMGLTREELYICNVIKCRPPGNRTPEPDEIKTCFPFLRRQLASIGPKIICTLGAVASRELLQKEVFITMVRGKFFDYKGVKVLPTFHPSYLLRNPSKKREVWKDVQKIMTALEEGKK